MNVSKQQVVSHKSFAPRAGFENLVGQSVAMQDVFDQAERVAQSDSTVLLTGRTGTGKDVLAQAIHNISPRRNKPFVAVNIAAVPAPLIESELFGHVRGAFTDAVTTRTGRFEAAHGGTLFIDEMGDLNLKLQAKLLRALETRIVNPLGSNRDVAVDVRVIAATSRDIRQMVARGQFREDLYYRLNIVQIHLPQLCERREDIPLLVDHFLAELARRNNRVAPVADRELQELFRSYDWPGNVRQLKNCLESMLVMNRGRELTCADLPATVPVRQRDRLALLPLAGHRLGDLRRQAIRQTLDRHNGNRTRTAECLGISVRTLQRVLQHPALAGAI
jgi:DNA-binding NtrC family response regulator